MELELKTRNDAVFVREPKGSYNARQSPSVLLSGDGIDILLACMRLGVDELRRWRLAAGEDDVVEEDSRPWCALALATKAQDLLMWGVEVCVWCVCACVCALVQCVACV